MQQIPVSQGLRDAARMKIRADELRSLWAWARGLAEASRADGPQALHVRADRWPSGAAGADYGRRQGGALSGLPFTNAFESHLEASDEKTRLKRRLEADPFDTGPWPALRGDDTVRRALRKMQARDGDQSLEYKITWMIVEGGYQDAETIASVLRTHPDRVKRKAERGLTTLRELLKQEEDARLSSVA